MTPVLCLLPRLLRASPVRHRLSLAGLLATALLLLLLLLGLAAPARAQAPAYGAPDSGQSLQQLQRRGLPPPPRPRPALTVPANPEEKVLPGGATVALVGLQLSGHTVLDTATLLTLAGDYKARPLDYAGLRAIADRIAAHYRASGYPFATVLLPPQDLSSGVLQLQVVEGRYGKVVATDGQGRAHPAAGRWLQGLREGEVIAIAPLQRAVQLLDDLPGVDVAPVVRPGQAVGTGDVAVQVRQARSVEGELSVSNHGNRYTGYGMVQGAVDFNSVALFGDQVSLRGVGSDKGLFMGALAYSAPVGASGTRAQLSVSSTRYQLAREFAALEATGTAHTLAVGFNHALLRSRLANVTAGVSVQARALHDQQLAGANDWRKRSQAAVLSLGFDRTDGVLGGGITYGSLAVTAGKLTLDADNPDAGHTRGAYRKVSLDIARQQALFNTAGGGLSLVARVSLQSANRNLDSSEQIRLGGPTGVRAFPTGEAGGDSGLLTQLELRWQMGLLSGQLTPFLFYDQGKVRYSVNPSSPDELNTRSIAGGGGGLRWEHGALSAEAAMAWQTQGGPAQSDPSTEGKSRVWLGLKWRPQ